MAVQISLAKSGGSEEKGGFSSKNAFSLVASVEKVPRRTSTYQRPVDPSTKQNLPKSTALVKEHTCAEFFVHDANARTKTSDLSRLGQHG